jgi:hypothetical protein
MRGREHAEPVDRKPASLMRRLALIAGAEMDREARNSWRGHASGIGRYFGVGLGSGAAAGALAFLTLHLIGLEPHAKLAPVAAAWTSWTSPISAPAVAASRPVMSRESAIDTFDMTLQRVGASVIPFPLRIVGAAEAVTGLVLRGMPPGVRFSRGEQRDDATWIVNVAELPYLQVALPDGAPTTFHLRIDVLARPEVTAPSSIARVHILDVPTSPREVALAVPPAPPPAVPSASTTPVMAAADAPFITRTAIAPRPAPRADRQARPSPAPAPPAPAPVLAPEPERQLTEAERHWPEGASGLGAVARTSERLVWWKLPAPTWSPFLDIAGR